MNYSGKGFRYVCNAEKMAEYRRLSPQQKLEWLEQMNRFLYDLMPKESKLAAERFRRGEI
ncbi:MAG: hypothetical protein JW873_01345 [Candidatus Saganbacteria bacterium]|nr:hypothetical protein [Candidatus Saganbacteria bacterium]